MKRFFTLILFFLAVMQLHAAPGGRFAAPTVTATNLNATGADGDRILVQWTNGNGAKRIVIARKDAPVSAVPVNGTNYSANSNFLQGNEIATGEFVVYNGTGTSVSVGNLLSSSHYYFAVFEYNGTGAAIEYGAAASVNGQTFSAPTGQPTNFQASAITGHSVKLSWAVPAVPNNGTGRIVLAREGAPVNVNPVDLANYNGQVTFGQGTQIGSGNYVVYEASGNTVTVEELKPNTTYYFAIFEYKGSSALVFNINNPPTLSATTLPRPTTASSAVNFISVEGNSTQLNFTKGDGARRIVIARAGSPVTAVPVDGVSYTANGFFGTGQQIAPGEYVVSNGTSASVSVASLSPATTYYYKVFEYDGTGIYSAYLTSSSLSASQATVSAPTTPASNISFTNVTSSAFTVNWQSGNGAKRLVVVRKTDPVNSVPADLSYYSPSSSFQFGSNVGPGNYAVYANSGSSVTVTGLTGGSTYHVAIFEYNGLNAPIYLTSSYPTASASVSLAPTGPATAIQFTTIEANRFSVQWQNGNGNRRMVVARAGSPVTAVPADGVDYTANNSFTTAPELAPGQKIVYNNASSAFTLFNLDPGTTYYFAVFEYNTINSVNYYLTSSFPTNSQSTVSVPDVNSTNLTFTNVTGNSMKLNWVKGNGGNRLILLKAGSPVDATPANFTSYTANTNLTLASQISAGNYIVYNGSSNSTTITGLDPDVTYYVKIFEYNGAAYPAYLTSGALTGNGTTNPRPSQSATGLNFYQVEGNKMIVRWTSGDGARRILVGRQGSPVTALPADGTLYTPNTVFGSGTALAPGQFVLSDNTFNETAITNLQINTDYYFAVFEYDGSGANIRYQTSAFLNGSGRTLAAPTQNSSNVLFSSITNTTVNVNWTPGNGDKHLVIVRKGAPVTAVPQNLQYYSTLASFGNASTIVSGDNYGVYGSTETSTSVIGLAPGTTYYFAVYDFNGSSGPVYDQSGPATGSVTTLGPPSDPATAVQFTNVGSNTTLKLSWTNGSGQKRLVLVKDNAPVDAAPVTGTLYNPNTFFGSGDMIGSGNYVVYAGASDNVTINNLVPGHTYYFAVFEYNQFPTGAMYLTTNPARATFGGFALPVRLLSFSGTATALGNSLAWKTASEADSRRFVIERSDNGIDFTAIGSVAAAGNSNVERSYSYIDTRVANAFYRLRLEDLDGKASYSKVIRLVPGASSTSMQVFPTVADASISVSINYNRSANVLVQVIDMQGRVVRELSRTVQSGANEFDVELSGLGKGSYVLQAVLGSERLTQKFIHF